MVVIDGAQGEGGGQVLRSALTLSVLTGKPFYLQNVRSRRPKPGLMPQHLKAVDAAAAICAANVEGATPGSTSLVFEPGRIRSGRYRFDIGTAGSSSLVLQTIFFPLSFANAASDVSITGGTHVPWSPCFNFLELNWLKILESMGFRAQLKLDTAGFYPHGGGRIQATIRPCQELSPALFVYRGRLLRIIGISAVANLNRNIAERQKRQAIQRLLHVTPTIRIKIEQLHARSKGTFILLLAEFERSQCCYTALGALGKPAEQVADEAVDALLSFLATDGAIDQYLADQMLLPFCLAEGQSEFKTCKVTQHLITNANIIRAFLPSEIHISGALGDLGYVRILNNEAAQFRVK